MASAIAIDKVFNPSDKSAAVEIFKTQTKPALKEVQTILKDMTSATKEASVKGNESILTYTSSLRRTVIVIVLMGLIVGIVMAWIIANGIVKPLEQGVSLAQAIAKGDLTRRVTLDQNDEIGLMIQALNTMTDHLSQVY